MAPEVQQGGETRTTMRKGMVLLAIAGAGVALAGQSAQSARSSLTGCVDERDGQYVLVNDSNLTVTARLQPAAGSAEDNFARHMGEKVSVRGKLSGDKPIPVLTVENLKTVSQVCAPAPEAQPK